MNISEILKEGLERLDVYDGGEAICEDGDYIRFEAITSLTKRIIESEIERLDISSKDASRMRGKFLDYWYQESQGTYQEHLTADSISIIVEHEQRILQDIAKHLKNELKLITNEN